MAGVTMKLTNEQQQQIKGLTGRNLTELHIELASTGGLAEKELEQVVGGSGEKPIEFLKIKMTDVLIGS